MAPVSSDVPRALNLSGWTVNISVRIPLGKTDEDKAREKAGLLREQVRAAMPTVGPDRDWTVGRFARCKSDWEKRRGAEHVSDRDWNARCEKLVGKLVDAWLTPPEKPKKEPKTAASTQARNKQ